MKPLRDCKPTELKYLFPEEGEGEAFYAGYKAFVEDPSDLTEPKERGLYPLNQTLRIAWGVGHLLAQVDYALGHDVETSVELGMGQLMFNNEPLDLLMILKHARASSATLAREIDALCEAFALRPRWDAVDDLPVEFLKRAIEEHERQHSRREEPTERVAWEDEGNEG